MKEVARSLWSPATMRLGGLFGRETFLFSRPGISLDSSLGTFVEKCSEGGKACPTRREPIPGLRKEPEGRLSSLRNRLRCLAQDGGRRSARHRLFWSYFEGPIWNRLRANIA